jgi:hypothetical protein
VTSTDLAQNGNVRLMPQHPLGRGVGVSYEEAADFGALAAAAGLERAEITGISHAIQEAAFEVCQRVTPEILKRVNAAAARRLDRLAQAVRVLASPQTGAVSTLFSGYARDALVSRQEVLLLIEQAKAASSV